MQTVHPAAIMRVIHYPPQEGEFDERVIGIGAHTEYVLQKVLRVLFLTRSAPFAAMRYASHSTPSEDDVDVRSALPSCGRTTFGGLQVRNGDGKWVQAPPIPGTFVVK